MILKNTYYIGVLRIGLKFKSNDFTLYPKKKKKRYLMITDVYTVVYTIYSLRKSAPIVTYAVV